MALLSLQNSIRELRDIVRGLPDPQEGLRRWGVVAGELDMPLRHTGAWNHMVPWTPARHASD